METCFKWSVPSGLAGQIEESVLDLLVDDAAAKKLDAAGDAAARTTVS